MTAIKITMAMLAGLSLRELAQVSKMIVDEVKARNPSNGNNGKSSKNYPDAVLEFRKGKEKISLTGNTTHLAKQIAGLLFGEGINDLTVDPYLYLCGGRKSANFRNKAEFDKVILALQKDGYEIVVLPNAQAFAGDTSKPVGKKVQEPDQPAT